MLNRLGVLTSVTDRHTSRRKDILYVLVANAAIVRLTMLRGQNATQKRSSCRISQEKLRGL